MAGIEKQRLSQSAIVAMEQGAGADRLPGQQRLAIRQIAKAGLSPVAVALAQVIEHPAAVFGERGCRRLIPQHLRSGAKESEPPVADVVTGEFFKLAAVEI